MKPYFECHINSSCTCELLVVNIGKHSELFDKLYFPKLLSLLFQMLIKQRVHIDWVILRQNKSLLVVFDWVQPINFYFGSAVQKEIGQRANSVPSDT